ncbi:MAG: CgeB family protein [Smithellaceae bacterium]
MIVPGRKYRVRYRLWRNNLRLKREQNDYRHKFQQLGLSLPDDNGLMSELKTVFHHLQAKPKGQLNIIAIYHHYNWENYSLKPAREKFGTVRFYDWFDEFNHDDKNWRKSGKFQMNKALVEKVNSWMTESRADLIFMYVSGALVEPETIAALRRQGVPLVNLALNDKEHFVSKIRGGRALGARDICRYFDLCWTSTEDAMIKYRVEGARPIYLPEGANPEIHKPYHVEKTVDVSFVGQCYGNRSAVIDELSRQGIMVETHGFGWPNGPLAIEDMVKLYSRSKINLGFGGVGGYRDTFCLKGRDFEIPMSGGLYLTEDHPELAHVFRPGQEILTYNGVDDLIQKIRYYLQHPDETEAIRRKGRERALSEHTWEARFARIFHLLGLLE